MHESIQGKVRERPILPGQQVEINLLYRSPPAVSQSNIHKTGHNIFKYHPHLKGITPQSNILHL